MSLISEIKKLAQIKSARPVELPPKVKLKGNFILSVDDDKCWASGVSQTYMTSYKNHRILNITNLFGVNILAEVKREPNQTIAAKTNRS